MPESSDANADTIALRPYGDHEVPEVLERLLRSPEVVGGVASFRFPRLYGALPWAVRPAVRWWLRRRVRGIATVREFQASLEPLFEWLVEHTTDGFSHEGADRLDPDRGYLFVSNHRDIALDPGLLNYALWLAGHDTVRIGIGDNLLGHWYATDLMRLNKSFVIPRSDKVGKALYRAYRATSAYIYDSIASGQSVWIAQREGRAKDGLDQTEVAVIKMLQMSRRGQDASFGRSIAELNLVPVSISYEVDPCDLAKARELSIIERCGHYEKIGDEDLRAIVNGIAGYKGRIHVAFGEPLGGGFDAAEEVAAEIDCQIIESYRIFPTHLYAWRTLGESDPPAEYMPHALDESPALTRFAARVDMCPDEFRPFLLAMYANPIRNRLRVAAAAQSAD